MASNAQPLQSRVSITNPDGTPTDYFIKWARQFSGETVGKDDLGDLVPSSRTITTSGGIQGGGNLSANRTLSLTDTGVTPGDYTNANITVDAKGRVTKAENGTAGSGGVTKPSIRASRIQAASGPGSPIVAALPTGTIVGDWVVVFVGGSHGNSIPSGWTEQYRYAGASHVNGSCFTKQMVQADITTGSVSIPVETGAGNYTVALTTITGTTTTGPRTQTSSRADPAQGSIVLAVGGITSDDRIISFAHHVGNTSTISQTDTSALQTATITTIASSFLGNYTGPAFAAGSYSEIVTIATPANGHIAGVISFAPIITATPGTGSGGGGGDLLAYAGSNVASAQPSNTTPDGGLIPDMSVTFTLASSQTVQIFYHMLTSRSGGSVRVRPILNGAQITLPSNVAHMYPIGQGENSIMQGTHCFQLDLTAGTHTFLLRYADAMSATGVTFLQRHMTVRSLTVSSGGGSGGSNANANFSPPLASSLTLSNSGRGNLTLQDSSLTGLSIKSPTMVTNALNHSLALRDLPAADFTAVMRFSGVLNANEYMGCGLWLTGPANTAFFFGARRFSSTMHAHCDVWNSWTSFSATRWAIVNDIASAPWRRIRRVAGVLSFDISVDNVLYETVVSENQSGVFGGSGATKIGFAIGGSQNAVGLMVVDHFKVT